MNRTRHLRVYITVEHAGVTYRPLDPHEHFPYYAISRAQVERGNRPLGADLNWQEGPFAPTVLPPEERAVEFICEGPDAEKAIEAIKRTTQEKPGPVFGLGRTLSGVLASMPGAFDVRARSWRPPGHKSSPLPSMEEALAPLKNGRRRRPRKVRRPSFSDQVDAAIEALGHKDIADERRQKRKESQRMRQERRRVEREDCRIRGEYERVVGPYGQLDATKWMGGSPWT